MIRGLAIALAALLVILLVALLAAPAFIDPTQYRDLVTAQLSRAAGRAVTIDGPLSFAVLPVPSLAASGVSIAGDGAAPPLARAERVEAQLALAPLLAGRIVLRRVVVTRPVLAWSAREGMAADRSRTAAPATGETSVAEPAETRSTRFAIASLRIADGTLLIGAAGGAETIEHIDLDAAQAESGAVQANATLRARGFPLTLVLALDRPALPSGFRLEIEARQPAARLEIAGELGRDAGGAFTVNGALTLNAADLAALLAGAGIDAGRLARPVSLTAKVALDPTELRLDDLALAAVELRVAGSLRLARAADAASALTLHFNRLDLDRLGAAPAHAASATPASPATAPAPTGASPAAAWPQPPPLRGAIEIGGDALVWHGAVVREPRLQARLAGDTITIDRLAALLPGDSDASLSGVWHGGAAGQFDGATEIDSDNLRALVSWLGLAVPPVPADRLRKAALSSRFTAHPDRIEIGALDVTVDATRLTGAATVALRERPAIGARLALDQLNLDAYLAPPSAAPNSVPGAAAAAVPASPANAAPQAAIGTLLAAFDANLDATIGTLTWHGQPARGVHAAATLQQGELTLHEASVADLANASAKATGLASGLGGGLGRTEPSWRIAFSSQGPELAHILRLALPEAALIRAVNGPFAIGGDIAGETGSTALDLEIAALGATAQLTGELSGSGAGRFDLALDLKHPSLAGLIARLAPGYRPQGGDPGPASVTARLRGGAGKLRLDEISLAAGPLACRGAIALDATAARPRFAADLELGTLALDKLLPARQAASRLPATPRIWLAAAATGDAEWSRTPLDLVPLTLADGELKLAGERLSYGSWQLDRPAIALTLQNGELRLAALSGALFGGEVAGAGGLSARSGDGGATIALRNADLGAALAMMGGGRFLHGRGDLDLDLASRGRSAAEMIATLHGSGHIASRDGSIAGIDLPAISARLARLDRPTDLVELLHGLSGGTTPYTSLTGTVAIADGVARSDDLRLAAAAGAAQARAAIDLLRWQIDGRAEFRLTEHPETPPFAIVLSGPLDAPRRILDVNALENHLVHRGLGPAAPAPP
jgi:uncharacterized protein involved in outer membrane biogenesis